MGALREGCLESRVKAGGSLPCGAVQDLSVLTLSVLGETAPCYVNAPSSVAVCSCPVCGERLEAVFRREPGRFHGRHLFDWGCRAGAGSVYAGCSGRLSGPSPSQQAWWGLREDMLGVSSTWKGVEVKGERLVAAHLGSARLRAPCEAGWAGGWERAQGAGWGGEDPLEAGAAQLVALALPSGASTWVFWNSCSPVVPFSGVAFGGR